MKYINSILCFSILILISISCIENEELHRDKMILFYFDGNNNLSSTIQPNIDSLLKGYVPSEGLYADAFLIYEHKKGEEPMLYQYAKNINGEVVKTLVAMYGSETVSADTAQLKRVIADARLAYPAQEYGLIFWSHGTGWLPQGYHNVPLDMMQVKDYIEPGTDLYDVKSVGQDVNSTGRHEIEIQDFAAALDNDYEFILFDCCLMSCIEVAYELRNNTKYIIASPTEVLTKGYPYTIMMDPLFNSSDWKQALNTTCLDFYNYNNEDASQPWGTVAMIDCSKVEALSRVCKKIFSAHRDEIAAISPKSLQQYDRNTRCWYNDIDDFVSRIASESEYKEFTQALNDVVVNKYATERFITIQINHFSGLSMYVPNAKYSILNEYYMNLAWNRATGLLQ